MVPEKLKPSEAMLRDAEEMRAFYLSVGISLTTTERAIEALQHKPALAASPKPKLLRDKRKSPMARSGR